MRPWPPGKIRTYPGRIRTYMDTMNLGSNLAAPILDGSRFVRACLRKPVDRTPVWFLRQAGRYMQEYRDVRKHHTLVEICKDRQSWPPR